MKTLFTFLLLLLVVSFGYSQKKGKSDSEQIKIDSLIKVNNLLSKKLDSISKENQIYYGVYTAVRDSVIKYNFDPKKTPALIDSLKTTKNAFTVTSALLKDSIEILKHQNKLYLLNSNLAGTSAGRAILISELRQIKDLLDNKIITMEEYNVLKLKILVRWE